MVYKLITAPTELAITLAQAKAQLNVEPSFTDDDSLITACIQAASQHVEKIIQGPVMEQVWELQLTGFATVIELHKQRITDVESVKYYNSANADTTVNASEYQQDLSSIPARIIFNSTFSAPTVYDRFDAVRVRFTAGYSTAADVPSDLAQWLKILVTQFYEARDYNMVKPETEQLISKHLMAHAAWL